MLACIAAFTLAGTALADIPDLSREVAAEAQALSVLAASDPLFGPTLDDFAGDAMALSDALRAAEAPADLPCIFRGISEDARVRGAEIAAAQSETDRAFALSGLHALLSDAIELAPIAAAEMTRAN
jgi:hypothetical protein